MFTSIILYIIAALLTIYIIRSFIKTKSLNSTDAIAILGIIVAIIIAQSTSNPSISSNTSNTSSSVVMNTPSPVIANSTAALPLIVATNTPEPTPIATNTPEPTRTSTARPTTTTPSSFRDDFDAGIRDEWKTLNAEYKVEQGVLRGTGTIFYPLKHNNVIIRARARIGVLAVFFRQQFPTAQKDGYYILFVGEQKGSSVKNVAILNETIGGQYKERQIQFPSNINLEDFTNFEVRVENNNATLTINSQEVGTFIIGTHTSGEAVGMGFFPGSEVEYFEVIPIR